jgi:PTH2 family peptidyl-tRNA hydrolase
MFKQVIVMRKDLNMRKGKMVGQGSHAVEMVIEAIQECSNDNFKGALAAWKKADRTKIVVSVNSEEELMAIFEEARDKGIPVSLVTDYGITEFKGIRTKTCLAIGPWYEDYIDTITGDLPLL